MPGGTSLHLVGVAVLLRPSGGSLSLLSVQTLAFHDGGITTLGADVINMGVVVSLVGYAAY